MIEAVHVCMEWRKVFFSGLAKMTDVLVYELTYRVHYKDSPASRRALIILAGVPYLGDKDRESA